MATKKSILIIEDDEDLSSYISCYFQSKQYEVHTAYTTKEALHCIENKKFDATILDVELPDGSGLSLLSALKKKASDAPVLVSSAVGEVQTVVSALKLGASDYIQKPVDMNKLEGKVCDLLETAKNKNGNAVLDLKPDWDFPFQKNSALGYVWRQIEGIMHSDAPIMIYGETGTGKTFLAKEIHDHSYRRQRPFIHINCPSIPENLIEREMFGHEKGAFTGADNAASGKLEYGNGGTVFLDEVGDIPLAFQAKLLRVLGSRQFERLGSNKTLEVDVRFIAATNRDLEAAIKNSNFREDLFYRLNVFPVYLPPLRERREDILPIAQNYLERLAHQANQPVLQLDNNAIRKLQNHDWPGNIRELENVLQRAFHVSKHGVIREINLNLQEGLLKKTKDFSVTSLREMQKQKLLDAIKESNGSITKMANILGVGRDTIYRRLAKYGIDYKK